MCGLCGVFGHVGMKEKHALSHLQIFSQIRGVDSTGVYVADPKDPTKDKVTKSLGGYELMISEAQYLFDYYDWQLKTTVQTSCVVGHHRKATVGLVTEEFAQPFEYTNIVGTHNGTIAKTLLTKRKSFTQLKNDSQILLQEVDAHHKNVAPVFESLYGDWAVVWYDKADHIVNLIRNTRRTLCYVVSSDEKTMFWASEAWMLHKALQGARIPYSKVWLINDLTHFTFNIDDKTKKVETNNKKIEIKHTPNVAPHPNNYPNRALPPMGKPNSTPQQFREDYGRTYQNIYVNRRTYENMIKRGCSWCTADLSWEEREKILWFDRDSPICEGCGGDQDLWAYDTKKEATN
jgi:asparagine synthetase B (glutamine-hydrolysing)